MTAPSYRSRCQHTGQPGGSCTHAAELDSIRDTIVAAAGFYDCPCGDSFELDALDGVEDLLALNRWTGRHLFNAEHNAAIVAAERRERLAESLAAAASERGW